MDATGLFRLTFWRALQLHHFLCSLPYPQGFGRQQTTFEEYCSDEGTLPQVLSKSYSSLITPSDEQSRSCLRKWNRDLNCSFTSDQQNIICFSLKSSICTKIQETSAQGGITSTTNFIKSFPLPLIVGDAKRERCFISFGPALKI